MIAGRVTALCTLLIAVALLALLMATFAPLGMAPLSILLVVAGLSSLRIAEKPVLGWGVDAARTIPGAEDEVRRYDAAGKQVGVLIEAMLPLHPHNAVLQWWLELGTVGVVMMVAFQVWLLSRIQALPDRDARAAAVAIWTSGFLISLVSYGFWQSWWQGAIWLVAGVTALLVGPGRRPHPKAR